ncbi:alpha/beta-hydrolase [Trametes coccinea BRFM310]|uniref:Palmitoyl-protein thioesterase 1 n=1 Tax=Trametes coccinea (strain BRFM310) TaxID=1353009 RepID=A0A1Y2IMW5_TRAC3|nr:alpha/beta-hydrolase [Trametes coccinea BRFM310]
MAALSLLRLLGLLLSLVCHVLSSPLRPSEPLRRPLVIWHGLGDSYASPGMLEFMDLIKEMHPGIFVHSVYQDEDLKEDERAGFFGDVNEQVRFAAEQIANITELQGGFDAIGFSQGGQFLRAYVEAYNTPPVHNLITFGSQHMGVSDLPACRGPWDLFCQLARRAARGGVYTDWAQRNLVQAQYFRDADRLDVYRARNRFLAPLNNEADGAPQNATFKRNLAGLEGLVLVLFAADKTVVPKESAWFGSYAPPAEEDGVWPQEKTVVPMRLQPLYKEDWIGLRELDKSGRVVLETCEGEHMQLTDECWRPLVKRYVGGTLADDEGYRYGYGEQEVLGV